MFKRKLKGRRVAVLAADGFEKAELTVPVKALRANGAQVDIVSLRRGRIRGVNLHEPAGRVRVNKTVEKADPDRYDALFIPGGFINPDLLRQSADARSFVRRFYDAGKPIASLCHGPWVLASTGILDGRTIAAWPGIRDDVVNAGATWLDEEVVRDGNLITSRGPQDLRAFSKAFVEALADESPEATPAAGGRRSSPQPSEPPKPMIRTMRWLPRPSLRAVAGVGGILALFAMARE